MQKKQAFWSMRDIYEDVVAKPMYPPAIHLRQLHGRGMAWVA